MAYNAETGMYEGYIYKITNKINCKSYIGQTIRDINTRWNEHKYRSKQDSPESYIHRAMKKYGYENFEIIVIDKIECDEFDELKILLDDYERHYIFILNTQSPNGYNISIGGDSSRGISTCIAVNIYNINKELLKECYSIAEACEYTGIGYSVIRGSLINNSAIGNNSGYIFKYKNDSITDDDVEKYKITNPTYSQYNIDGVLLNVFNSKIDLLESLKKEGLKNVNWSHIKRAMMNDGRCAYGYIWRQYPDIFDAKELPDVMITRSQKRIEQRDMLTGELINIFDNYKDVIKKYPNFKADNISICCKRDANHTIYGYIWNFEGEYDGYIKTVKFDNKMIDKYDVFGNYIETYENIKYAAESVDGKNHASIRKCCEKIFGSAYGYIWRYHGDELGDIYNLGERPVVCYDLDKNEVGRYLDAKEASIAFNTTRDVITRCCNGGQKLLYDKYVLRYFGDDFNKYEVIRKKGKIKPVVQLDKSFKIIKVYESGSSASKENNINQNMISGACNHKRKYAGGYIWMFLEEYNKMFDKEVKYA